MFSFPLQDLPSLHGILWKTMVTYKNSKNTKGLIENNKVYWSISHCLLAFQPRMHRNPQCDLFCLHNLVKGSSHHFQILPNAQFINKYVKYLNKSLSPALKNLFNSVYRRPNKKYLRVHRGFLPPPLFQGNSKCNSLFPSLQIMLMMSLNK